MKVHELKTIPPYFDDIAYGEKRSELRYDDRSYRIGDILVLREYHPENDSYTGETCAVRVKYILKEFKGIEPGYCILTISDPI